MHDANAVVAQLTNFMPQALVDMRHPVYVELGAWLVDVIQTGERYHAVVEDCGYDVSTFSRRTDERFDLSQYEKTGEFLDMEIGPNTRATYMSRAGFLAETLDDVAMEVSRDAFSAWIRGLFPGIDFFDLWDDLMDVGVDEGEFHARFRDWLLEDVMARYLSDGLALRARRREAEEERERRLRASSAYGAPAYALMKQRLMPLGKFEVDRRDELKRLLDQIAAELSDGPERIAAALATTTWPFAVSIVVGQAVRDWFPQR